MAGKTTCVFPTFSISFGDNFDWMFRSRLKRCQPLHPSANGATLKKTFVVPRSTNMEPITSKEEEEKPTITSGTNSSSQKIIGNPVQQKHEYSIVSQTNDTHYCFSYELYFIY